MAYSLSVIDKDGRIAAQLEITRLAVVIPRTSLRRVLAYRGGTLQLSRYLAQQIAHASRLRNAEFQIYMYVKKIDGSHLWLSDPNQSYPVFVANKNTTLFSRN